MDQGHPGPQHERSTPAGNRPPRFAPLPPPAMIRSRPDASKAPAAPLRGRSAPPDTSGRSQEPAAIRATEHSQAHPETATGPPRNLLRSCADAGKRTGVRAAGTVGVHSSDGRVTPSAFHGRPRTSRADAVSGTGGGRRSWARLHPGPSEPRAPSRDKCGHGMGPVAVSCPSRDGLSEVAVGSRDRGDIRAPSARTTMGASGCRRPGSRHESYHRA
jgi:hypothetical protein